MACNRQSVAQASSTSYQADYRIAGFRAKLLEDYAVADEITGTGNRWHCAGCTYGDSQTGDKAQSIYAGQDEVDFLPLFAARCWIYLLLTAFASRVISSHD